MICSSSTTSAPDPRRGVLAAVLLLAMALAGPLVAAPPAADSIAQARQALVQQDGIAAEVLLRRAMDAGAPREAVAALMGEALLLQEATDKARVWLEPGEFTPDTAALGFRTLARIERLAGNLAASGKAYDRALAIIPRDATLWVEIGRLRYDGGEHTLALEAADLALELAPGDVRVLEFKGQFVRDQQGLAAALPWFEKALEVAPNDVSVLGEYAATLGDLGQAKNMLAVTRQILAIEPGNPRALFLQAVLAARAGKVDVARGLLARTGDKFDEMPAAQLLRGVLEMQAGNYRIAAEALEKLCRAQPANARAALLLARAYILAGENRLVVHDNAGAADRAGATPYLLALVARAYEADGRRDLAAPFLDRAALARRPDIFPVAAGSEIGSLLAVGNAGAARAAADRNLTANPGSAFNQAIAGDVRLFAGDGAGALEHYRRAAQVRLSDSLLQRMVVAAKRSGRADEATALIDRYLAMNAADPSVARMAASGAAERQDWSRARLLLESLRAGGTDDVNLLADLSLAQLRGGDAKAAEATARAAHALQRGSPAAAAAWGLSLDALGQKARAQALLDKSRRMFAAR